MARATGTSGHPKKTHRALFNFRNAKKAAFVASYKLCGNITAACEAADIPRASYYVWTEHDPAFGAAVEQAKIEAIERLELAARRRAEDGVKRITAVYHDGEVVGYQEETRYSDLLLIFLLKALAPDRYRERQDITLTGAKGLRIIIDEPAQIDERHADE